MRAGWLGGPCAPHPAAGGKPNTHPALTFPFPPPPTVQVLQGKLGAARHHGGGSHVLCCRRYCCCCRCCDLAAAAATSLPSCCSGCSALIAQPPLPPCLAPLPQSSVTDSTPKTTVRWGGSGGWQNRLGAAAGGSRRVGSAGHTCGHAQQRHPPHALTPDTQPQRPLPTARLPCPRRWAPPPTSRPRSSLATPTRARRQMCGPAAWRCTPCSSAPTPSRCSGQGGDTRVGGVGMHALAGLGSTPCSSWLYTLPFGAYAFQVSALRSRCCGAAAARAVATRAVDGRQACSAASCAHALG